MDDGCEAKEDVHGFVKSNLHSVLFSKPFGNGTETYLYRNTTKLNGISQCVMCLLRNTLSSRRYLWTSKPLDNQQCTHGDLNSCKWAKEQTPFLTSIHIHSNNSIPITAGDVPTFFSHSENS